MIPTFVAHCLAGRRPQPFISDQAMELNGFEPIVFARDTIDRSTWGRTAVVQSQDGPGWADAGLTQPGPTFDDIPTAFVDAVQRHDVGLLHAHHGMFALEFLSLRDRTGLPMVVSFYGFDISGFPRTSPQNAARLRQLFSRANLFLAMSEDMRADLIKLGCPRERTFVNAPAVVLERFPYRHCRRHTDLVEILCVSDFSPKKGVHRLIDAFARVHRTAPQARLHLAGEPITIARPNYETIRQQIVALGLEDIVQLSGWRAYDSLPEVYSAADIFVLPSEKAADGSKEGVPAVILEASATGLPVVSTRHAGIPEAVVHGTTGLLVEEGDVSNLAVALTALVRDASLRERMGRAGRRHMARNFDISAQRARLERFYTQVLREQSASTSDGVTSSWA